MGVFRRSLPLLATSFVNRCGTIGLSLLPILLVERHVPAAQAALVMSVVQAAGTAGVLGGGLLADRAGASRAVLASFLLQGVGLGLLPLAPALWAVTLLAVAARVGQSMFMSPARLLLVDWMPHDDQQEAIGWLRTANNAGQIVSYTLGAVFSALGVLPLMLFDAATSLAAATLGAPLLRRRRVAAPVPRTGADAGTPGAAVLVAVCIGGFTFLYELFMTGTAASFRLRFGEDGLRLFSTAMVVNTVLCTLLGVWAARRLRDPRSVFPAGMALTAAGVLLALHPDAGKPAIFLGVLVATLGEVVFASIAPFVLLRLLPEGRGRGARHGGLLVLQDLGRIGGAAAAFPFVVHGGSPVLFAAGAGAAAVALSLAAGRAASPAPEPAAPAA